MFLHGSQQQQSSPPEGTITGSTFDSALRYRDQKQKGGCQIGPPNFFGRTLDPWWSKKNVGFVQIYKFWMRFLWWFHRSCCSKCHAVCKSCPQMVGNFQFRCTSWSFLRYNGAKILRDHLGSIYVNQCIKYWSCAFYVSAMISINIQIKIAHLGLLGDDSYISLHPIAFQLLLHSKKKVTW